MFIGLSLDLSKYVAFYLSMFGIAVGISSFILLCASIRCPQCGARWMWLAVSKKKSDIWQQWLLGLNKCPVCELDISTENKT